MPFTPRTDWPEIEAAYRAGEDLAAIAARFGIASASIRRKARVKGWPGHNRPEGKPKPRRKTKKKPAERSLYPTDLSARVVMPPDCTSCPLLPDNLDRLKAVLAQSTYGAGDAPGANPQTGADRPDDNQARLAMTMRITARLYAALSKQMAQVEARLREAECAPGADAPARERDARTLASLTRTFEKLLELDRSTAASRPESDMAETDLDAFRQDLARRLEALRRSGG